MYRMKEEIFDELKPRMTKRYRAIHEQITDVIQACGVEEYVEINTVLHGQSIIGMSLKRRSERVSFFFCHLNVL